MRLTFRVCNQTELILSFESNAALLKSTNHLRNLE